MNEADWIKRAQRGLAAFTEEMKEKGIHVGLGASPPVCVIDGEPWPCSHERAAREGGE